MINGKRVVATVSARMGSTRLPGKVLLPLLGKPVLERIVERLKKGKYFDEIVIATSTDPKDDAIENFCVERGYLYYRGSEDDVLARVYETAKKHNADIVYRGMGDSPLVDVHIVDMLLEQLEKDGCDLVSNEMGGKPVPDGFDATVFTMKSLEEGYYGATHPEMREHVTVHIKTDPSRYKVYVCKAEGVMDAPDLRLTLDTKEDYEVISNVFEALYPKNSDFTALDVIQYLREHPEVAQINSTVVQKMPTLLV